MGVVGVMQNAGRRVGVQSATHTLSIFDPGPANSHQIIATVRPGLYLGAIGPIGPMAPVTHVPKLPENTMYR